MLYYRQNSRVLDRAARTLLVSTVTLLVSSCNWIGTASLNSSGEQANGDAFNAAISSSGRYVAFGSGADNLVAGDIAGFYDVFVRDTRDGLTTRVSVDSNGNEANQESNSPAISDDGTYIAFDSDASNLVADDTNNATDIFVHDRDTGATTRVSVSSTGVEADCAADIPAISGDGKVVAFKSCAGNLVAGVVEYEWGIFIHQRDTGATTRVSVDNAGNAGNDFSYDPELSLDGRYIVFSSYATNLVANDTNAANDIFVHDRATGTTTRVSVATSGVEANDGSDYPAISEDGRYIAFSSTASNLVTPDTNRYDVFVHDRHTGTTKMISVDSMGNQGNGGSYGPEISADGRFITYQSEASNLVADDSNGEHDIFVFDQHTQTTFRVSEDAAGAQSNGYSSGVSMAANGRYVAFPTVASNLTPEDTNDWEDIVIKAIPPISVTSLSPTNLPVGATTNVTISGTNFLWGAIPVFIGAQTGNIVIEDENTITVDVIVPADATPGALDVAVGLPGTGAGGLTGVAGTCKGCATFLLMPPGC
jgi:hypothetical protein